MKNKELMPLLSGMLLYLNFSYAVHFVLTILYVFFMFFPSIDPLMVITLKGIVYLFILSVLIILLCKLYQDKIKLNYTLKEFSWMFVILLLVFLGNFLISSLPAYLSINREFSYDFSNSYIIDSFMRQYFSIIYSIILYGGIFLVGYMRLTKYKENESQKD